MSEVEWMDIFVDNLLHMMDDYGYNQRLLAEVTGLSEGTISKYISKQQMPGVKAVLNIAYAFNCSLDDLIDFGDRIE